MRYCVEISEHLVHTFDVEASSRGEAEAVIHAAFLAAEENCTQGIEKLDTADIAWDIVSVEAARIQ